MTRIRVNPFTDKDGKNEVRHSNGVIGISGGSIDAEAPHCRCLKVTPRKNFGVQFGDKIVAVSLCRECGKVINLGSLSTRAKPLSKETRNILI